MCRQRSLWAGRAPLSQAAGAQAAPSLLASTATGAHAGKATQGPEHKKLPGKGVPARAPELPVISSAHGLSPGPTELGPPCRGWAGSQGVQRPHLYPASRPRWRGRSHCSPRQPSAADAPRRCWTQRHSAKTRTGRWGVGMVPGHPPPHPQLNLSPIRLELGMEPWEVQAPRRRQMAGT